MTSGKPRANNKAARLVTEGTNEGTWVPKYEMNLRSCANLFFSTSFGVRGLKKWTFHQKLATWMLNYSCGLHKCAKLKIPKRAKRSFSNNQLFDWSILKMSQLAVSWTPKSFHHETRCLSSLVSPARWSRCSCWKRRSWCGGMDQGL